MMCMHARARACVGVWARVCGLGAWACHLKVSNPKTYSQSTASRANLIADNSN